MNRVSFLATALFLSLLAGCGSDAKDADSKLVPVSGKVTYNGESLKDGTITFILNGDKSRAFTSPISNGSYTLVESVTAKGAIPGEYKVTVVSEIAPTGGSGTPDPSKGKDQELPKPESRIPVKYSNKDDTDLKATVPTGGKTIDFELKD